MTLHFLDYLIIILSLVVSVGIGVRFSGNQKSTAKFFTAEGKIPAWAIGLSLLATLVSSITFLAFPGEGYSTNWIRLVQGLMVPIVLVFMIFTIVPFYRKVIGLSAYEYFEKRFGYFARHYSSLDFMLAHFSKMGTVFYLIALAMSSMMGIDILTFVWILGAVIILLTLLEEIEGLIWLDVVQGIILIGGGILALFIILFTADGGGCSRMANGQRGLKDRLWSI